NDVLCQLAALRRGFYSEVNFFTPVLQTSSESGRRSFHSAITPGCATPCPSPNWRRASRRALRCGQPACSGQWRRRHGSGELPCMQRGFPAASCRLPEPEPERSDFDEPRLAPAGIAVVVRRRPRSRAGAAAVVTLVGI